MPIIYIDQNAIPFLKCKVLTCEKIHSLVDQKYIPYSLMSLENGIFIFNIPFCIII